MKNYLILNIILIVALTGCSKDPSETDSRLQLKYYELAGVELEFPADYEMINNILIDVNNDSVFEFEVRTYYEPVTDLSNPDSVYGYHKLASLKTLNDYQVPSIACHVDGGSTISLQEGDTINNSILDIFPRDYKCSCSWCSSCYILKSYNGGYTTAPEYLAVRLMKDDEEYFGWLHIQTAEKFIAKSFAISQIANKELIVGQIDW